MPTTCVLEVVAGAQGGKRYRLEAGRTVIGRHPMCGIVLDAPSVSRQHAAVTIDGDEASIEDLGSRNGTFIGDRSISGRRPLRDGDRVVVGNQRLRFSSNAPLTVERLAVSGEASAIDFVDDGASAVIVSEVAVPRRPEDAAGRDPQAMLRAALGLDRAIGNSIGLEQVLPRTLEGLFEIFPKAERGFLLLVDPTSNRLVLRATKSVAPAGAGAGPVLFSRTLMDRVVQTRQAVLSADAAADSRFDFNDSVTDCGIRSVMCMPFVRDDGVVLGVLQIDRSDADAHFVRADLDLLASVASTVTRAIEQAQAHEERLSQEQLRRDLELAHRVQQGLLPASPPDIPGYEWFDYYEPARQISGDFFSYVPLSDGRTAVVLADVSGKGISAALVMAALSADVRYCLASEPDVAVAVSRINESICRSGWEDRFATLLVAVLDPRSHRIMLVNAGHMPPLIRAADATLRSTGIEKSGLPLGIDPAHAYTAIEITVEPGSTLVLYTDGISEAMDQLHRPYGLARLRKVVAAPARSAAELGRNILADVERHAAGQVRSDDICLVCLGRSVPRGPKSGRS